MLGLGRDDIMAWYTDDPFGVSWPNPVEQPKYRKFKAIFQVILATRHRFLTRARGYWGIMENRWSGWKCRDWGPKALPTA